MRLEKFGLEIRKIDNIKNFYYDVDRVLEKYNVPEKGINASMQRSAVAHALQKMFAGERYFNICTIDTCMKLCQVVIPKDRYNVYHSAHCLNWSEMTPEYREMLTAMVLDDFRAVLTYDPNEIIVPQAMNRN